MLQEIETPSWLRNIFSVEKYQKLRTETLWHGVRMMWISIGRLTWQRMVVAGRSTHSRSKIPSAVKILFLVFSEKSNVFCSGSKHTKICDYDDDDDDAVLAFAQAYKQTYL